MDNSQSLIKQGDKQFKLGKEALTTGLFQWKKDYNLGAMHFEDASKLYKQAKCPQKEIEALKKSVECNEQLNDMWAVARNYEALITCWIENPTNNYAELVNMTMKSGMFFKASDSGMKTLHLYVKVAKFLTSKQEIQLAEQLILEALNESDEQQAPSTRGDILSQYTEILVEKQRFGKAGELYLKEIERCKEEPNKYPLSQMALIVIILFILQDEVIRANNETETLIIAVGNFHKSSEFKAADQMLGAYEKGDQQQFNDAIMRSCVTCIYPPNIIRALRKVKVRAISLHTKKQMNDDEQQIIVDPEQQKTDLERMIL